MDTVGKVLALLDHKAELFAEFEKATQELLVCDVDDVEHYITRRGELANEIDSVMEEIGRICDAAPGGGVIFDAANARIDYDRVPPEYHPLFAVGQNIRSVVSRVRQTDKQVVARLEGLRDDAKDKIRQNQNIPKIKKYLTDLADKPGEAGLTTGKA